MNRGYSTKNPAGAAPHMPVAGEIDPRGRAAREQSLHLLDHLKTWFGQFTLRQPLPDHAALQRRWELAKLRHFQFLTLR